MADLDEEAPTLDAAEPEAEAGGDETAPEAPAGDEDAGGGDEGAGGGDDDAGGGAEPEPAAEEKAEEPEPEPEEKAAEPEAAAQAEDAQGEDKAAAGDDKGEGSSVSLSSSGSEEEGSSEDEEGKKKMRKKKKGGKAAAAKADPPAPADAITDINTSPEAHAEVDEMAQEAAREVLRSRQSSMTGDAARSKPEPSSAAAAPAAKAKASPPTKPPAAAKKPLAAVPEAKGAKASPHKGEAEREKRRSSDTNSQKGSPRPGTVESLQPDKVHPPSPSKIKTGPWLKGTYKLPKTGKIITGEELCESLERMTNAYIDRYANADKGGANTVPHIATGTRLYMSKTLTQDEYDNMIGRLYKPKDRSAGESEKSELLTLKYGEDGKEQWVGVKTVDSAEQTAYMCQLYDRCLERKKKTTEELAEKYLKPLGQPRRF